MEGDSDNHKVVGKGIFKWIESEGDIAAEWIRCNKILFLIGCILAFLAILFILVFRCPEQIAEFDARLKPMTNILPLLSLLFAIGALFIAVFSYKSSILRPRLKLKFAPLQQTLSEVQLSVDLEGKVVGGRPMTEWELWIENIGETSARYPMVRMVIEYRNHEGIFLKENAFPGWTAVLHSHGKGYYGFQWSPEGQNIIYPGFSIKLPSLSLIGKCFEGNFLVVFTYVADGAPKTSVRIPVKVYKQS